MPDGENIHLNSTTSLDLPFARWPLTPAGPGFAPSVSALFRAHPGCIRRDARRGARPWRTAPLPVRRPWRPVPWGHPKGCRGGRAERGVMAAHACNPCSAVRAVLNSRLLVRRLLSAEKWAFPTFLRLRPETEGLRKSEDEERVCPGVQ